VAPPAARSAGRDGDDGKLAAIITAISTVGVVAATLWLVKGQLSIAAEQRKIQLYLELRKEY
jgi:hypothetical protein